MAHKLPNYLRTFRRRAGYAQNDIAFLLDSSSGTRIGRHERFDRLPLTTTVFAYEVIFRAPARELFAGVYERIEREITRRALALSKRLGERPESSRTQRKLESLKTIYVPFAGSQEGNDGATR